MADSTQSSEKTEKISEQVEGRKDLLKALLLCIVAVVFVRSFLFEPFKIPSSSMVPSLKIGDHIFVSKFNYSLSIPFTKIQLVSWALPKRGDVIVFLFPRDESLHYIKRVVGVPGDIIEFRGRDLHINGERVAKRPVVDAVTVEKVTGKKEWGGQLFTEVLSGVTHFVQYSKTAYEFSNTPQVGKVPPDQFFVVGDNRDDSYDSRAWGYVPRENIKGRAQIIWLSLDHDEKWGKLSKIRWERVGIVIR